MFQSAPVITDGRSRVSSAFSTSILRFNPRPSSLTGDPPYSQIVLLAINGFNPRPSSLTGDPSKEYDMSRFDEVSIRARHH